jgi:quercetin dioxygenase-like cupin family protein
MVAQTTIEAGTRVPDHAHPHEQITYVVKGRLEMCVGVETYVLGSGDSLLIPSEATHCGTAQEETTLIDVFSPPREDFA